MAKSRPFFSIVVPTFNRANLISETLRSLQNQTYSDYEIIVIDDGSTDATTEVVRPFLNEKTSYHKKENSERGASRNFGARLAKGRYINFFDSDDVALPNHLDEAFKLVQLRNNPEWFHLAYAWSGPNTKVSKEINKFRGETLNQLLCFGNTLSCNGVFVRNDIIIENQFNEDRDLSASEDYELWLRLAAKFPLYYSNEITTLVIDHNERSVRTTNLHKLEKRMFLLLDYLKKDKDVLSYYRKTFLKIEAELFSYIAIHIANERQHKTKAFAYLLRSIRADVSFIKRKRFYAVIKNILTKW